MIDRRALLGTVALTLAAIMQAAGLKAQ